MRNDTRVSNIKVSLYSAYDYIYSLIVRNIYEVHREYRDTDEQAA